MVKSVDVELVLSVDVELVSEEVVDSAAAPSVGVGSEDGGSPVEFVG